MHHKFRDKIKQNFVELVTNIEPDILVKFLLDKKIFNDSDKKAVFSDINDYKHNNRLLLFRILKKNDAAFHHFVEGLEAFGLRHLFTSATSTERKPTETRKFREPDSEKYDREISKISNLNLSNSNNDEIEIPDSRVESVDETTKGANVRKPLVVNVKMAEDFPSTNNEGVYDTKSIRRGQVLIINNRFFDLRKHKERKGSNYDVEALTQLFKQMNMNVQVEQNKTVVEMKKIIENFAQFDDDKISDICVVAIMSHGAEREKELVVLDKHDAGLPTSWIEEQFNNVNCKLFSGKPKVFLYQVCRGFQKDFATTKIQPKVSNEQEIILKTEFETNNEGNGVETDSGYIYHIERRIEDMLLSYATQPGHRAHRDPTWGSWYIQLICEVFMEKAHNTHIIDMLNEVDRKLKLFSSADFTMQTSTYTCDGFNKHLYFNPGIYLDESGTVQKFSNLSS